MINSRSLMRKQNQVKPKFAAVYQEVKNRFFSRNPDYWPIFKNPDIREIVTWRQRPEPAERLLKEYPGSRRLLQRLHDRSNIPRAWQQMERHGEDMARFCAVFSKNWENPGSVENVITMSADPAVYGSLLALIANPNLVHVEYAGLAVDLEKKVIRQIASLIGYNPRQATGIFTQGGTFCNLYGYLLGIRKSLPEARSNGMGYTQDYRFINSMGGHYSNITNLSLLGINIRDKTIRIKIGPNNDIDLHDLEFQMESCFRLRCVVPTIMLTMGTTDTFGVDRVKPVYDLRNRLAHKFGLKIRPHIHVDAAVGWAMLFFRNYDCARNELGINEVTRQSIRRHQARFAEMRYADSCTIDFQKWGYVPYTSSLVMIRHAADLNALRHDPELFCYFDKHTQGYTHLTSTIECSRGAAGVFGAYTALQALGIKGYQVIIAHCLQNANYFRMRLSELRFVKVIAEENMGPSVGFRVYSPAFVRSAAEEFIFECAYADTAAYHRRVRRNTAFHHKVFQRKGKVGLFTNWIGSVAHTDYNPEDKFTFLPGEKAVFFNPHTTTAEIDVFIDQLVRTVRSCAWSRPLA